MALFPRPQEKRQRERQARGATPALQPSVYRRGMFRRGNSPISQPSIARPGAFAGQPKVRLEGGGLGGQARMPDSLPPKTSSGPRRADMLGGLVGADRTRSAETSQYASFPASPAGGGGAALFPNEGPLKNAPASQSSMEALDRSRAKDTFLNSGLRLAGEDSLRSGLSPDSDLSPQMRSKLRGMGVGQGADEKGLPSNSILGQPQPTLGYYSGQLGPESSAGSGTVIAPGQDQNVMDSRISKKLNAFNPQDLIVKSESDLELEGVMKRQQEAKDEIAAIKAEREKLNPMFDSSDPFNMANAAGPRMPTTAEGDLARRSRQAAAGIGDPLSAAEQSQLSEFRARNYAAANGLPYIPPSSSPQRQTSRRSLPDVTADAGSRSTETTPESAARRNENDSLPSNQLRRRSTVNRQTMGDGTQVTFGMGTADNPIKVEDGNIILSRDDEGRRRAVVLPSSGYSLGLRTAEVDGDGNFIPGTFRTQSDEARRKERQDLAIAKGNAPGATPEEKVAGKQAQEAQDKYSAYKERMRQRRSDALDLRRDANAMRSYGPIGQQFMGLQGGAMGMVSPVYATKYGQTGPSLGQAAGMVRQQRDAQERMDKAMRQKQEDEMAKRRQDMLLEAYKANPNDPRLQDAFAKDLGLRDRTSDEQARFNQDQFNLKINSMTQNNELTMDPRQVPGAGVGDLDTPTKSMLVAGIDDALKSDLLTDEDRMKLFRNVDLKVMAELIDGTEFDELYFDGDQSERVYKDFKAFLKRTGQVESKPENDFYQSGTLGGPNDMF